jgi:acyl-CoA synthetase (AMP-forming)/AMP-acid ligase II
MQQSMSQNSNPNLPETTIIDALQHHATRIPGRLALRFLESGESISDTLTFQQLDARCRQIAGYLETRGCIGERVLLTFEPGLSFICAFLGCLYARAIPVPVDMPRPNRPAERMGAILRDSQPKLELTSRHQWSTREHRILSVPELRELACVKVEEIEGRTASAFYGPGPAAGEIAFLQYTSGSTGQPKGVIITHSNITANQGQMRDALSHDDSTVFVSWLPLFHDMGLVGNVLHPLYLGVESTLFPPLSFIQKPARWLRTISTYRATTSGAPNFAYDHCIRRITSCELEGVDLSCWSAAFTGSEPVRADTIEAFTKRFSSVGFRADAFYPCYGLAEATLLVCGGIRGQPPYAVEVNAAELEAGLARPRQAGHAGRKLVSSGVLRGSPEIRIVDAASGNERPGCHIGEIWIAGGNVTPGYWNYPADLDGSFGAILPGVANRTFFRTGDLGYVSEGRLFVTGRSKDVIIVHGRNLYPQDIELTVSTSHRALIPGRCAAFGVDGDGEERLVAVQEARRHLSGALLMQVQRSAREAVARKHDIVLHALYLVNPGLIPFTSSGKVRRSHCRELLLEGTIAGSGSISASSADHY